MKKIIFVLYAFTLVLGQDKCHNKIGSCSECIQEHGCSWDFSDQFYGGIRCSHDISSHSDLSKVYNPDNTVTVTRYEPLSETVLLAPQAIEMKLRLLTPYSIRIEFQNEQANSLRAPNLTNIQVQIRPNGSLSSFVTIEGTDCSKHYQQFNLTSEKTNQNVTVDLELLCTCPCEEDKYVVRNSPRCHNRGTYRCGVCECQSGTFGAGCECTGLEESNQCTHKGAECSNRGLCICGRCECEVHSDPEEIIFGAYCECDNFSCPRVNGKLCGGPDRGSCVCGICECRDEWQGNDCNTRRD